MVSILKNDLYRFGKSKLLYGILFLTFLIAFALTMIIRQDIRLGISVFGNLMAFRGVDDVIRIGLAYYNGLGIFVAILLSVFIGQEYQWKTWQHKWITNKSRVRIYLSKFALSSIISSIIFLVFQAVILFGSNQAENILTAEYAAMVISGVAIYAALGASICLLSMLIKNSTASIIACLGFVLFSETIASVIGNIGNISETAASVVGWIIRHSIYGMATVVSGTAISWSLAVGIAVNALVIMALSTAVGILVFRRYEL